MNVTFVLAGVGFSGGVRVIAIYAHSLQERGHRVTLVSCPPGPAPRLRNRLSRFFARRKPVAPAKSFLDDYALDHRVIESARPISDRDVPDADVVIATWWETAEWVSRMSAAKGAKAYLIQGHEVFYWLPSERVRATYRLPVHKIVISQWLRDIMAREYQQLDVDLVHNGIDHRQFNAPPRSKQSQPTVAFMYTTADMKGVDITLEVIRRLRQRLPTLRVVSFGHIAIPDTECHGVEFTLKPAQDHLRVLYASCDVWLTASRSEGFNLPAMEAMACRTPVVSTRTGWPPEVLRDGVNGWCVEIDDVAAMTEAAYRVLMLDDTAWQQMSSAAYETVIDCTWERSTVALEAALLRAVAGAEPAARASGAQEGARESSDGH